MPTWLNILGLDSYNVTMGGTWCFVEWKLVCQPVRRTLVHSHTGWLSATVLVVVWYQETGPGPPRPQSQEMGLAVSRADVTVYGMQLA